jgi:soluble lytic murein transglycosylase-like protein
MKTWLMVIAAALVPMSASAQLIQANENGRAAIMRDIETARATLLPPAAPVTARFQPRLDAIKASVAGAKTPAELIKGDKDLAAWRSEVVQALFSGNGGSFAAFGAAPSAPVPFSNGSLLRQDAAARNFGTQSAPWTAGASWDHLFDNNHSRFAGAAPVRAPARPAASDPARYAKVRALLLSQGVSPKIVDTAIAEGIRQKVDPMIVLSVINQESEFRKNARNRSSGATGLMQLMPETAADMGVRGSLYDPAANIKAGVKYLNWIANSFFKMNLDMSDLSRVPKEKLKMVLASYNWGVGNVRKTVNKYGAAALDRVAPKETRNYIAEIPSRIYDWFASF